MNFTGLGPYKWKYKIDRPLGEEEKRNCLHKEGKASKEPDYDLSVICLNSTYMELVDRWYSSKGHAVVYGIIGAAPFVLGAVLMLVAALERQGTFAMWFGLGISFLFSLVAICFFYLICLEAFRRTHYPIRVNRKNRMVYAFKPDGKIVKASWDDLFFCKASSKPPLGERDYDIRAHVLDADGETIRATFTLAMPHSGAEERLVDLWEYVRRYMEEDKGVVKNYELTQFCWPISGRREGVRYGIIGGFSPAAVAPYLIQLPFSPYFALITWGRLIAMYTSRVPHWPESVEAECSVADSDPYFKDWRDNRKLSFKQGIVPVIGFVIGSIFWGIATYYAFTSLMHAM